MSDPRRTPSGLPAIDADTAARIAEDKARIACADHADNCKGLERVEDRMDQIESKQREHEAIVNRISGALGLSKVLVPVSAALSRFVGAAVSSTAPVTWQFFGSLIS
jgi:hypothetical protein